jgi:hypothetical protein
VGRLLRSIEERVAWLGALMRETWGENLVGNFRLGFATDLMQDAFRGKS